LYLALRLAGYRRFCNMVFSLCHLSETIHWNPSMIAN
jgi:hypothetical protein